MLSSTSNIDWSNPQEAQNTMESADLSAMNKFKDHLNECMADKIGGTFAKNMEQGKASWMTDVKITRTTHPTKFSQKKNLGLLIAIKDNGKIWINKKTVKLKNVKSMAKDLVKKNPIIHAVIIADKNAPIENYVSVMDQLKSAGIDDISLAGTKPN